MEERYCQSCGMPMGGTDELYGTDAGGGKSGDYCKYCFTDGAFTSACTMQEMIEICVPHTVAATGMSAEAAREMMRKFFPALKRWRQE